MKKKLVFSGLLVLLVCMLLGCGQKKPEEESNLEFKDFQTGDIILHTSKSNQSQIIRLATNSKFSHMGIIEVSKSHKVKVIEAVGPVKKTNIKEWIKRGVNENFAVVRLKEEYQSNIPLIIKEACKYLGKPYDLMFEWGDDKIYCSELVYKAFYKGAGVKLGHLRKMGELNLEGIEGRIKERYGKIPYDLEIITPQDIFESDKVEVVHTTYDKYTQKVNRIQNNLQTKKIVKLPNSTISVKEKKVEEEVKEIVARIERYCKGLDDGRAEITMVDLATNPDEHKLHRIGTSCIPMLMDVIKDKNRHWYLRIILFHVISNIDEEKMVEPLIKILEDKDDHNIVRAKTAEFLGGGNLVSSKLLLRVLETEEDKYLREEIADVLYRVVAPRTKEEWLIRRLIKVAKDTDEDEWHRNFAIQGLGVIGGDEIVEVLSSLLHDKTLDRGIRSVVLGGALGRTRNPKAIDPLIEELKKGSMWAAEALGELEKGMKGNDKDRIVEALIESLKHEEGVVRGGAGALGKIGDKRAVEPLIEAFKNEDDFGTRRYIACVLGELGDKRAIKVLEDALLDPRNNWIKEDLEIVIRGLKNKN